MNLIHFVAKLYVSKNECEKEVMQLNATNIDINQKITGLEDELNDAALEHSTLKQSLCELKEKVNMKEYELENMKTKYSCLENEFENLNNQFLETNNAHRDLQKTSDDKLNELNHCKHKYQEVLSENQRIKDKIVQKEQKISECEKTILEKRSQYEVLTVKSKDYEAKIDDLNSTITNLTFHVEEVNKKVANLEKSNNLLNATLENVEEELQNTYMEKKKLEENLQEKANEIKSLQQEISSAIDKRKINEISNLESTIKELRDSLQINEKEYAELQNKNCKLQNEISSSMRHIKELKVSLLEKNFCIQKNDSTMVQLNKTILEYNNEKKNLNIEIMNLNGELEKKITLLYDLENKLDKVIAEKDGLQNQVTDLLSFKHENLKMLENERKSDTRCKELISENTSLRSEIENLTQEKSNLVNKIELHCDKISTIEADLKETVKFQENLNNERDDLKKKLHILKEDMRFKSKSHLESSFLIQELTQKVDKLRKEISDNAHIAEKKINELSRKNESLLTEIDVLKSQPKIDCRDSTNSLIETSGSRSSDNFIGFFRKLIDVLSEAIKKIECSNDAVNSKAEFLSELKNWEDNITDSDSYIDNIFKKLHSFLQNYINIQKDLESKLDNLGKTAVKYMTELNKYCESSEFMPNFDVTVLGDISCLNDTLCTDSTASNAFIHWDFKKLTNEMQKSCEMVDSHFNSMRNTILKKEMEVKSLQDSLIELKQLKQSLPNEKQNVESKCKLLLTNAHRLEKKHNKLIQTCEEMQSRIKILEKEKQDLENEAEEMAGLIKNQTSSDELLETYKRLAESNKELELIKEENGCLKTVLKRYESFVKENSINVSKVAEQSQSNSS